MEHEWSKTGIYDFKDKISRKFGFIYYGQINPNYCDEIIFQKGQDNTGKLLRMCLVDKMLKDEDD